MKTVAILMSTFNGEKYLREQIDSILNQEDIDLQLFVRDDGSSDNTRNILAEYEAKSKNVHCYSAQNIGVGNSFMELLYATPKDFDYYAFSDQDDIWEKNKLIEAIKFFENKDALLYVSNQECVNSEGESLGLRWEPNDSRVFLSPEGILCQNVLCGCTMLFTNRLYKILVEQNRRPSSLVLQLKNHDGWIALIAAMLNGIVFDNRSFIKYRQHSGNVVGAYRTSFSKKVKMKFKKLFHNNLRCYRSNTARELCLNFPELTCKYPLIEMGANSNGFEGKRIILKNHKKFRCFTGESYFNFYFKVLFGLF